MGRETKGGEKGGVLDILHSKNHMPHLLKHPPHAKTVGQLRIRRPLQHAFVVMSRPLQNARPADGKLPAADVADVVGHLLLADVEQRLVHLREEGADVVFVDVDLRRGPGVHVGRTARVVLAAQVDVALRVDGLEPQVAQGGAGARPEQVVVPLVAVRVDEDGVVRQVVVVVDDEGEVGGGFSTARGSGDEEVRFGGGVGGVDEGGGSAGQISIQVSRKRRKGTY